MKMDRKSEVGKRPSMSIGGILPAGTRTVRLRMSCLPAEGCMTVCASATKLLPKMPPTEMDSPILRLTWSLLSVEKSTIVGVPESSCSFIFLFPKMLPTTTSRLRVSFCS